MVVEEEVVSNRRWRGIAGLFLMGPSESSEIHGRMPRLAIGSVPSLLTCPSRCSCIVFISFSDNGEKTKITWVAAGGALQYTSRNALPVHLMASSVAAALPLFSCPNR